MPGIFSWKPRFRTRKVAENDVKNSPVAECEVIVPKASTEFKQRAVRFSDLNYIKSDNGLMQQNDNAKYDVSVVGATKSAPLASDELDEALKETNESNIANNNNNINLVNNRRANNAFINNKSNELKALNSSTTAFNEKHNRIIGSLGVVYLEYNDEVKRALLPPTIQHIEAVRALFLRSFSRLTPQYLNLPHIKIYIQEASKGQLFYELDDLNDIKDQAVLKIREQLNGYQSPQPIRFSDHHPSHDYLSESEIDLIDYRSRVSNRFRPTSALDGRVHSTNSIKNMRGATATPSNFENYYDSYASDTSSQGARSGSVTPIVDREARFRMETMERQLAGLSSLVHSALVSKGISETSQRDVYDLRKQIMALHPDVASESSFTSSTEPSLPDSVVFNDETQQKLSKMKRQAADAHNQLRQLRRCAQINSQHSRDILRDAFERIRRHVIDRIGSNSLSNDCVNRNSDMLQKSEHNTHVLAVQKSLQRFEEEIEEVRRLVLNTDRKLRMNEVETFTQVLTQIGRNAAKLKTQFPKLQRETEKEMKQNMERIIRDEKFIKEEASQIDQCLRRCKTLANMMVTMKKLAMVQDPNLSMSLKTNGDVGAHKDFSTGDENECGTKDVSNDAIITEGDRISLPPPIPPAPVNYESTSKNEKMGDTHVLDTILDELTNTVQHDRQSKSKSPSSVKSESLVRTGPPKPPERYSTIDVRSRFTPSQVQEIKRRAALNCSGSLTEGARQGTANLEVRQEKLTQKQRQLHCQFEQLQQMCAPSNII